MGAWRKRPSHTATSQVEHSGSRTMVGVPRDSLNGTTIIHTVIELYLGNHYCLFADFSTIRTERLWGFFLWCTPHCGCCGLVSGTKNGSLWTEML